jgi:hypothetical protein
MARTMRSALLAAAITGVGWQAYVHRRKLLKALGQVCSPCSPRTWCPRGLSLHAATQTRPPCCTTGNKQSALKSSRPAAWAIAGGRMGHQDRQARPRRPAARCARGPGQGGVAGVRSARDLLADDDRRLHDRDPNGLAAYVTSRAVLTGVPWRAVRARPWPRSTRSTRPRSWRGTYRCAAGPLPALVNHLCRPPQVGAFAPNRACICAPLQFNPPFTKLRRRRWSAWPCARQACRPRCPRWWHTWRCCTALPAAAWQPRRRRRRSSMGRSCRAALLACAGQAQ